MKQLPDKPSELIRLALADIRKAEQDPLYVIHMGQWHEPVVDDHAPGGPRLVACTVCFAGSVMAFSLDAAPDGSYSYNSFGEENQLKLEALDSFRVGDVRAGLKEMGITHQMDVGSYGQDAVHWKQRMGRMAELLARDSL